VAVNEVKFFPGHDILINRTHPPPPPLSDDASPAEALQYMKDHQYVARIQEIKAISEEGVYIRLFWYYWPHELPGGAQDYHGESEMILSNHADIMDATTVSGPAPIQEWTERDDSDSVLKSLYWRQTYDVTKMKTKNRGLSAVPKHCVCRGEYNPDFTTYMCPNNGCKLWNHVECLEDRLRSELQTRLNDGTFTSYLNQRASSESEGVIVSAAKTGMRDRTPTPEEFDFSFDYKEALTPSKKRSDNFAQTPTRDNILISITNDETEGTVLATIRLREEDSGSESRESTTWTIKLDCLSCGKTFDQTLRNRSRPTLWL
jgi:hypothetical protein